MAKSPIFHWTCVFFLLVSASADQKNITAETGQNITLPCRAPNNNILIVEWNRPDLVPDYVLLYRDEQFDPEDQHPSFENRVDLQLKDGDASLILKNVTINDTGTYECRVFMRGTNRREKRANFDIKPIKTIYLTVAPPGPSGGVTEDGGKEDGGKEDGDSREHLGIIIPLSFICVAAILITVKQKKKNSSLSLPSDKESEQMQV